MSIGRELIRDLCAFIFYFACSLCDDWDHPSCGEQPAGWERGLPLWPCEGKKWLNRLPWCQFPSCFGVPAVTFHILQKGPHIPKWRAQTLLLHLKKGIAEAEKMQKYAVLVFLVYPLAVWLNYTIQTIGKKVLGYIFYLSGLEYHTVNKISVKVNLSIVVRFIKIVAHLQPFCDY